MSVALHEIVSYGSANMPGADGATAGGAVDLTKKVSFFDIPAAGTVDLVSSSASDTATKIKVKGRDATGLPVTTSAVTLTGTTLISNAFSSQQFERLQAAVISGGAIAGLTDPTGTSAVGDVAVLAHTRSISNHTAQAGAANKTGTKPPLFKLQSGDGTTIAALTYAGLGAIIYITGGTGAGQLRSISAQYSSGAYGADIVAVSRDWDVVPDNTSTYDVAYGMLFDIGPNPITAIARAFIDAQADIPGGSQRIFYEKLFLLNTNSATALLAAQIEILSESPSLPSGAVLDLALCKALNDTATITNRQTLPANDDASSLSFVTQPSLVSVIAGSGQLPPGNAAADAQAVWLRLTLDAGVNTYKGAAALRVNGSTV